MGNVIGLLTLPMWYIQKQLYLLRIISKRFSQVISLLKSGSFCINVTYLDYSSTENCFWKRNSFKTIYPTLNITDSTLRNIALFFFSSRKKINCLKLMSGCIYRVHSIEKSFELTTNRVVINRSRKSQNISICNKIYY